MKNAIQSLKLLLVLTAITGVIYPSLVTLAGQIFFPEQAQGSLLLQDGTVIGSRLIGQKFVGENYFWGRPSSVDYNPMPSGGSNLGPTAKKLVEGMATQKQKFNVDEVPSDLLFSSASGIDPHITPAAAEFQIERIIKARGWGGEKREAIRQLIHEHTAPRQMGFLGEKRVNVLQLNLALDQFG